MKHLDSIIRLGVVFAFFSLQPFTTFTQEREEVFGTNTGQLKITAIVADTVFRATTKELIVILNYQTAEFTLILDKADIITGNDSLNNLLDQRRGEKISFTGSMNLPYIKQEKHPPKDIEISGYLSTDKDKNEVLGEGRLEYLYNGRYASMLIMSFILDVNKMGINIHLPGLEDQIQVELTKAVLNSQ
ncbi:MAG: hypothetical protein WDZ35_10645 [Crocinitomicaceae bacterium]